VVKLILMVNNIFIDRHNNVGMCHMQKINVSSSNIFLNTEVHTATNTVQHNQNLSSLALSNTV